MNGATTTTLWRRLLDGRRSWGSLDVSPSHYGVTRYRLVVFPPGMRADERTLLRMWRAWPTWGTATFLMLEILLAPAIGPDAALWISSTAFLGGGAVTMTLTAPHRGGVRTLVAIRRAGMDDPQAAERFGEFYAVAHALIEVDQALAAGAIEPVDHELAVWRAYDRMAAAR